MKYIAAYGTLRVGHGNFKRFPLSPVKQNVTIKGYKMFDLGFYPYILKSEEDSIVVDILECTEDTLMSIRRMEVGAGYQHEIVDIEGKDCEIYYFQNYIQNTKQIENGDYNSRNKK